MTCMPEFSRSPLKMQILLGLALLATLPTTVAAQQSGLDEIVVTSSRVPLQQKRIATSVAVLNAEDIAARGNNSLAAVLSYLPGTSVSSNGGSGQITSLRIRGEEGFRTLTVLDGIRLSDPASTQIAAQLEHLLSSGIGKVELLRGPQGLAYGTDAGGVLNISSQASREGMRLGMDLQSGTFDTQQYSGTLEGAADGKTLFLNLTDFSTAGFNSLSSDTVLADADGYDNQSLHLKTSMEFAQNWQVELVHRQSTADTAYDYCFNASFALIHDCNSEYELQASRVALAYQTDIQSHSFSYATTVTDRSYFSDGSESFAAKGELERLEYQGTLQAMPGFDVVYGADLEQALNEGSGRYNRGYYTEVLSDFSDELFLSAGLRHDANDDFGSNNSYRISAAWLQQASAASLLKFRGSLGTGFRAPSPYEIAYNTGPWAYPPASNTKLLQEQSKGWELGVDWYWKEALQLSLVYFDQKTENAIDFDLTGFSGYLQETGTSLSRGFEFSGSYNISPALGVDFNYTHNNTQRPNGLPRRYRPEQLANLGLAWEPRAKLQLNAFLRYSAKPFDEAVTNNVLLKDFVVLDLNASYQLSRQVQFYARLENALDEQYQEIATYNTADRAGYLGFRLLFAH